MSIMWDMTYKYLKTTIQMWENINKDSRQKCVAFIVIYKFIIYFILYFLGDISRGGGGWMSKKLPL